MNRRRLILVTGSASGIGAALAKRLRADGDEVIGLDRRDADIVCDLTDPSQIEASIAAVDASLDGLALVAGLPGTAEPCAIFAVNTVAPRLLAKGLAQKLREGAAIVVVSSITAARCPLDDAAKDALLARSSGEIVRASGVADGKTAYEYSKALINRWVQHAARDFLPRGIRVNAVSPGPVATPILSDFEQSIGADRIAAAAQLTGRHGAPQEIAAAIRFLLSADAGWINGTELKIDGGYHALRAAGPAPAAFSKQAV
jgi:NAD(P)-dependent dehydrogenase (short-subunit alcohol dehydrogenase family)